MPTRTSAFRRIIYTNPDLRVSDAERSDVADRLARHYGDGRLTQDEFNERVDQAMSAKTQSDLSGLFTDLPPVDEGPEMPARRPHGRRANPRGALFLVLIAVLAVAFGHTFWWFFMPPWLAVCLLVAIGLYVLRGREAHRDRHHDDSGQQ
jgi:Flp pilus assembly protein TadB